MTQGLVTDFDDAPGYANYRFNKIPDGARKNLDGSKPSEKLAMPIVSEEREKELAEVAVKKLKKLGVDFGDLRLGRDCDRQIWFNDESVGGHVNSEQKGIGIRALVKGFWGFSATPDLNPKNIEACAERAVAMAKAVSSASPAELGTKMENWADEPVHNAEFHTPVGICPFTASIDDLAEPLAESGRIAMGVKGIIRSNGRFWAFGRRRVFASTEGSYILSTHAMVDAEQTYYAVKDGTSSYRSAVCAGKAGGLEHYLERGFPSTAKSLADEAVIKCGAKKPDSGKYTLILDGHNLALTMHESVGHPTELDRVLGYEFGFAGGSFAGLDKLNNFKYGSPIVNLTANNRLRYGNASQGFDDEGVECQSFPLVKEGILVGYGTNRETAHKIGLKRSNGTCRSTYWHDVPIVRIPNLFLEPGKDKLSLDELIGDTKDGIYMMGRDSFSIDQMRYNFQFGANMCYRIENGKLTEPLRDVIYQSITPEFWNSCDAICDESEWQLHGFLTCGKGQPMQSGKMLHGASPSRFRNITVGY